jgi:glycosyltransferase involved in cell wall biosynthesis
VRQTTGYRAKPRLAAILIVKGTADEAPHLARCLANISPHVDGLFLNINHRPGAKVHGAIRRAIKGFTNLTAIETVWHDDFAAARNANLAMVPSSFDWVIWLDVDDTVDKPQKIRQVAEASANYDAVYADYEYDHDEAGNPITVHMVARLFRHNGAHAWKGRIHETLIETRSARQGMTHDFQVIHHAAAARTAASFKRNIGLLERQLEDESADPDPRTFYYLASTYMDAGQLAAAQSLFGDYLQLSGWDQERAVALTKLGRIHLSQGDRSQAKIAFARAMAEDPDGPEPWVELGSLEVEMENYAKARPWLEHAEKMAVHGTTLERNPLTTTFRCYLLLAECYLNLGGKWLDAASDYAKKALKFKPQDKQLKTYVKAIDSVVADKHLTEQLVKIYQALKKEPAKQDLLMSAVPKQLEDNPLIVRLRDKNPQTWPAGSIAIMTGDTALDAWGPWSLQEGIGGSEEAIIRLAPKLAARGYKVVVFAKPGDKAGLHDGVMWRNYWECNLNDSFDIFVAWRAPFIFEKKIKARKSYLWMHDVMEPGEFTPERIANFTKCILLSNYHRSLFPMIPDDKVLMSGNGIDPEEFEGCELERDPHKILYASSHVRGLAYLYKIWPEVKAAVPDATLDVYYGRESYDKVHRGNPERLKWMDDMIQKAKQLKGVTDHGKAPQAEIVKAGFRSGLWAYPCPFPEIYCITAIKSQASGAVPVASNYAALDETIQFGHKQHLGEFDDAELALYRDALIWWLLHPEEQAKIRPKMMAWAKTQSWERIAKQWTSEMQ